MTENINRLTEQNAALKAELDAVKQTYYLARLPRHCRAVVTLERNVRIAFSVRGRLVERRESHCWIIRAPFQFRNQIYDCGFHWDKARKRWYACGTSPVVHVAEFCDTDALAGLDERDPTWRARRPDLFGESE